MSGDIFEQLAFFQGLGAQQLDLMRPLFVPCDFPAGTVIFEQGDQAIFLYIVVTGEVNVEFKPYDAPPMLVARVKPGGVFGWSAALGSQAYTSGAVSATYTQLLRVRGEDLRNLCDQHRNIGAIILERLAAVIAQRMSSTHPQVMAMLESGLMNGKTGGKP
jgi:CRP-like cAMP-binding protein